MAIRFRCDGCSNAIEVDDLYAGQEAICPYCQKILHVPAASTLAVAAPAGAGPVAPPPPDPATTNPAVRRARTLGNASVALGLLGALLFLGLNVAVVLVVWPDLNLVPGQTPTREEFAAAVEASARAKTLVVASMIGLALCAAGFAFGAASMSASGKSNGRAIAGLIINAPFVLCCVVQLFQLSFGG